MRHLPFFEDPETREDILDHISGFTFDRALVRNDEPMRTPYARIWAAADRAEFIRSERKRSVRR
jgi:hypothetical protein